MIKRIITFVLCVALCVSCIAIGVINQKANEAGAVAGAIIGAGTGAVDKISADVPEGATQVEATELYEKDGVYYLGSDINLVTGVNTTTYDKLVALIDNKANGETAVTIDGLGHTITTDNPLFNTVSNVTIKNINVDGDEDGFNLDAATLPNVAGDNSIAVFALWATGPVTFENITTNVNITVTGDATGKSLRFGAFASLLTGNCIFTNCVNNGDITVTPSACNMIIGGGIIGREQEGSDATTLNNCINNGNITAKRPSGNGNHELWVGGVVGNHNTNFIVLNNVMNTGDVYAEQTGQTTTFIGGIIGHNTALKPTDCINTGDVTLNYTGAEWNSISKSFSNLAVGGLFGRGFHNTTFTRCINTGDAKFTTTTNSRAAVAGIIPYRYAKGAWGQFTDCLDIGTHSAQGNNDHVSDICAMMDGNIQKLTNCYATNHNGYRFPGSLSNKYYITVPANIDDLVATIEEKQITNGAAIFSAILAGSEYDANFAHDQDDGMFLTTVAGLTVTADAERNNYFTTAIDKDYLDALKAIAGSSVEIGAIITPATYVDKIGEFTHDAFDAYYTANKTAIDAKVAANGHDPITALYMTAAFGDGADFTDVDGVYNAGIYLKGAYDTAYAAKMYVKIGDAYVYSK